MSAMLNSVLTFAIYVDHIIAQRICTSKFHTVKEVEKEEEFSCILKCGYKTNGVKKKSAFIGITVTKCDTIAIPRKCVLF